jgi:hypothetical protein
MPPPDTEGVVNYSAFPILRAALFYQAPVTDYEGDSLTMKRFGI